MINLHTLCGPKPLPFSDKTLESFSPIPDNPAVSEVDALEGGLDSTLRAADAADFLNYSTSRAVRELLH